MPDPTTPGFGGPLAGVATTAAAGGGGALSALRLRYRSAEKRRAAAEAQRAETAMRSARGRRSAATRGSSAANKSATGYPWLGGFPQTGIQTPSIMHFAENRSAEGTSNRIHGIGMEFAGAPLVLIGQTDSVAYTTTTALLRLVDTFFEQIVSEDTDALRYNDEGTPAPLQAAHRDHSSAAWRRRDRASSGARHERNGNGGSRPVIDFIGDREGTVDSAAGNTLVDAGAFDASFIGGHVAIVDGRGAGQIRADRRRSRCQHAAGRLAVDDVAGHRLDLRRRQSRQQHHRRRDRQPAVAGRVDHRARLRAAAARRERARHARRRRASCRARTTSSRADNQAFNGVGTASRQRQHRLLDVRLLALSLRTAQDSRLPIDGTRAEPAGGRERHRGQRDADHA